MNWKLVIPAVKDQLRFYGQEFGTRPSIRTVFYALVDQLIPNTRSAYKYLDRLLVAARKQGEIPWGSFSDDETRRPSGGDGRFLSPEEALEAELEWIRTLPERYSLPVWHGQDEQVVVAVEKGGLRPLVEGMLREYAIPVFATRGYGAWESIEALTRDLGPKPLTVLQIGDFDPSGDDIRRFTEQAITHFRTHAFEPVAITKEQIERLRLPHTPEDGAEIAKLRRDPRFRRWPYGLYRVEVEAFIGRAPHEFRATLLDHIGAHFSQEARARTVKMEADLRHQLQERIDDIFRKLS